MKIKKKKGFVYTLKQNKVAYAYIAPFYILFAIFGLFPIVAGFGLSFLRWDGIGPMHFNGVTNYINLFKDPLFWKALSNTLLIGIIAHIPILLGGLALAYILNSKLVKGENIFKTIYFMPMVTSSVAISIIFQTMFGNNYGVINWFLSLFGGKNINWLGGDGSLIKVAVIVMFAWKWVGWNMVIYLAGMQGISGIAARYMNGGQAPEAPRQKTSVSGKASVQPVRQVRRNIVSLLAAPLPDSVFAREFVKPRNWGFNTVGSDLREPERNSIRAAVQQTVTLTDGGEVTFRLLEPMMAGDLLIPSGTPVTGAARINGERLTVKVSAVQHGGAVVPVDLSVYDTNGNEGIPVPGSEELNAVKEIAANMGAGMGSSITITDDAGSQLLSDLGRSAIQGVSQYVSKKMRSVKVTLKAGYSVLLLPPLQ